MNRLFTALFSALSIALLTTPALAEPLGHAIPWQLNFQEAGSENMERIEHFHDILLVVITAISVFVMLLLGYTCWRFSAKRNPVPSKTSHHTMLEVIWTTVPVLILLALAVPSFRILYKNEHLGADAPLTLKVTGYQWYWNYEYPEKGIQFDSNLTPDKDIKEGQLRLLEVDNRIVLPVNTNIRVQTTAADVIHAFAIPAVGVKIDAVPGQMNELIMNISKEGVYRGQCSELCGVNHGFMPIVVEAVSQEKFDAWVLTKNPNYKPAEAAPADSGTAPGTEPGTSEPASGAPAEAAGPGSKGAENPVAAPSPAGAAASSDASVSPAKGAAPADAAKK